MIIFSYNYETSRTPISSLWSDNSILLEIELGVMSVHNVMRFKLILSLHQRGS